MRYDSELRFLQNTLKKSGVKASVVSLSEPIVSAMELGIERILYGLRSEGESLRDYLGTVEGKTLYKLTDPHQLCYLYFALPDAPDRILLIGPYLPIAPATLQEAKIALLRGTNGKQQKLLEKYMQTIPAVPDGSPLFLLIDTFCEHIWQGEAYAVLDISKEPNFPATPINHEADNPDHILMQMHLMEERYRCENELMQAVTLGQIHKSNELVSLFSSVGFEKRTSDPLRNMKNYCVIMNTLLRKAAEQGGVHPIYLDNVSSAFARKIEGTLSVAHVNLLMREMFRSYCRLVRRHSMKDYSPLVQNAIVFIESDLSANLSSGTIAEALKVSTGYLSTSFKRETGKTVTEYIREKRIKHAIHLLSTTHLQIQTVALNCGIPDLQYFSKIFKRHAGLAPKEYRESLKNTAPAEGTQA